jgi:hypothetical protein
MLELSLSPVLRLRVQMDCLIVCVKINDTVSLIWMNFWLFLGEADHLEESGVDGRIILKWIFERLSAEA